MNKTVDRILRLTAFTTVAQAAAFASADVTAPTTKVDAQGLPLAFFLLPVPAAYLGDVARATGHEPMQVQAAWVVRDMNAPVSLVVQRAVDTVICRGVAFDHHTPLDGPVNGNAINEAESRYMTDLGFNDRQDALRNRAEYLQAIACGTLGELRLRRAPRAGVREYARAQGLELEPQLHALVELFYRAEDDLLPRLLPLWDLLAPLVDAAITEGWGNEADELVVGQDIRLATDTRAAAHA